MSARVLLALVILSLHLSARQLSSELPLWSVGLSGAYLLFTLATRVLARPHGPERAFNAQWVYTVGIDVLYFGFLQAQQATGIHYTPLMALPVLMAAILGSRAVALGTAAMVALILLTDAAINARAAPITGATELAQAGLMGAGLLALAWLTHHLAVRLRREQLMARRSRTEAQMQTLVNNLVIETLNDGVLVVDTHGTVRAANPAARLMLGSDEEVTPDRFNLGDNPAWAELRHIVQLTFSGDPVQGYELTLHHEDRHASQLKVRTERTPSLGADDPPLCVLFLQDLREMEAQLRTEKLASMGRMSAAVAHELRNPLAAISQANALLEEELTAPAQRRLTTMIRHNSERLAHIVDDVLDVARVQGQPGLSQAVALDQECHDFCAEWADQHGAGQRLTVNLRAHDVHVRFAHDHLRRLLVNLLDNAARYAGSQRGSIQVETETIRHGPVVLLVWSNGAPLEASVLRHLFEPFFSSESRSSGLGLFISRELCERHGATIAHERRVREQNGALVEGNEFFIHFRRAPGGHSIWNLEELTIS